MVDGVLIVDEALGRAMEKIRKRSNEPLDFDDPIVDGAGMSIGSGEKTIVSWKDRLLGTFGDVGSSQKDEDFILNEGNAVKEVVDGIPSIKFSEQVHDFITQRMSKTVIVKLLGRRISYHAMENKAILTDTL
ncbi:hypothetical protein Gogos_016600 [Gossypium gossypioides]|uniref:Uncharacterized protein n=1 Tax=Gossypium gossypioides TaxID=34282 RepID=A0A7J9B899_GOSGO|nr:hypothetical protein [Gossypium gossypioides]